MLPSEAAVGMTPVPSGVHIPDDIALAVLLAMFVAMGLNTHHLRHITATFFSDLASRRQRANIFDLHNTTADARTFTLMMVLTSAMEGILLAGWSTGSGNDAYLKHAAILSGIAIAFNLFSYASCATVGYTFTTPPNASQWRHTLNASQVVLGIGLIIPATLSVISPDNPAWIYVASLILYISVRICYIFKGFSFFYSNLLSYFYFILYLCALEIIPVIAVVHAALMLSVA